jgi:hypothetical protein
LEDLGVDRKTKVDCFATDDPIFRYTIVSIVQKLEMLNNSKKLKNQTLGDSTKL